MVGWHPFSFGQAAGRDDDRVHYTVTADLYSAGVVACELAARHLLVPGVEDGNALAPTHPDTPYVTAGPLIRDGLAVLRSLPGARAAGECSSVRGCLLSMGSA